MDRENKLLNQVWSETSTSSRKHFFSQFYANFMSIWSQNAKNSSFFRNMGLPPSLLKNIWQKWSGMASLTLAMFVTTPIVCPHSLSSTITYKFGLFIDAQCWSSVKITVFVVFDKLQGAERKKWNSMQSFVWMRVTATNTSYWRLAWEARVINTANW